MLEIHHSLSLQAYVIIFFFQNAQQKGLGVEVGQGSAFVGRVKGKDLH